MHEHIQRCIQDCLHCQSICPETVTHCLQTGERHAEAAHIRLPLDCVEICQISANVMQATDGERCRHAGKPGKVYSPGNDTTYSQLVTNGAARGMTRPPPSHAAIVYEAPGHRGAAELDVVPPAQVVTRSRALP